MKRRAFRGVPSFAGCFVGGRVNTISRSLGRQVHVEWPPSLNRGNHGHRLAATWLYDNLTMAHVSVNRRPVTTEYKLCGAVQCSFERARWPIRRRLRLIRVRAASSECRWRPSSCSIPAQASIPFHSTWTGQEIRFWA